ncbi:MAG: hypothetical protein RLY57_595 [Candidatus Parcubacteria bacterium]|jgi:hypothetical protein
MNDDRFEPVSPEVAAAGFKAIFEALKSDAPPPTKPPVPEPPEDDLFERMRPLSAEEIAKINRASPD